ncbi:MAG TPA: TetR/AcrR family transcriptional regulator [Pseudonocardiaceae bacterium]|nr:TetR/AcrR family transcriptional regulator [Pseudonocardiaceae bacterium]
MTGTAPAARRDYGGRTATQRRAERRQRLLTAALELFGTEGYPATSIERLCARANVSTRNFYEEFASREALLIALHDHITQQAFDAVMTAVGEVIDEPTAIRLDRAVDAYIGTTSSDPRWTRIAYVEVVGVSAAVERHRLAWRAKLAQLIEAEAALAAQRGEAVARDYSLTATAFIGAVNELVYHWSIHGRQVPLDTIRGELTRLALAALAITPSAPTK